MVFEDKIVILEFFTFCTEIVLHDTLIPTKYIIKSLKLHDP